MLKLKYKATTTFTSADIGDMAEPEIIYHVWANRPDGWTDKCMAFFKEGEKGRYDTDLALDIVGLSLTAVEQDGERWPVEGREGAEALRDSVEEQNPGYGDAFIHRLAISIFDQQIKRENDRLGNSEKPLTDSVNGKSKKKSKSPAKSA